MKTASYQVGVNEVLQSATYHNGKLNHVNCYWPHFYGGTHVTYYLEENKKWVSVHHCDSKVMGAGKKIEDVKIDIDQPVKVKLPMEIPDGGWYCSTGRQYGRKLWMDNTGIIHGLGKSAQTATV